MFAGHIKMLGEPHVARGTEVDQLCLREIDLVIEIGVIDVTLQ